MQQLNPATWVMLLVFVVVLLWWKTELETLEESAQEARKDLRIDRPCRRGSGGRGNRVSGQAYLLAFARLESACVALSGTLIVGLNKSGSESASRSPNDTHVRMGRGTFCACHHFS